MEALLLSQKEQLEKYKTQDLTNIHAKLAYVPNLSTTNNKTNYNLLIRKITYINKKSHHKFKFKGG